MTPVTTPQFPVASVAGPQAAPAEAGESRSPVEDATAATDRGPGENSHARAARPAVVGTEVTIRGMRRRIGRNLRDARLRAGLSQAELGHRATAAGVPLDSSAVCRIEQGRRSMALERAAVLAEVLDVRLSDLLVDPTAPTSATRVVDEVSERWLVGA